MKPVLLVLIMSGCTHYATVVQPSDELSDIRDAGAALVVNIKF